MAGHSSTSQPAPGRSRPRLSARPPSLRTAIIIFVGLLILFRWLHLILALQIASTGRQIDITTDELHRIERHNMALMHEIAEAEAPANLSRRAYEAGYRPRQPVYLRSDLPLARPVTGLQQLEPGSADSPELASGATAFGPWDALARDVGAGP